MEYTMNDIYELLQKNQYDELLEFEKKYQKEILADPMLKDIFDKYLIVSVSEYLKSLDDKFYSNILARNIYSRFIQHRKLTYSIKDSDFESFIDIYIEILIEIDKEEQAYNIAKKFLHLDSSKDIIAKYEKNHPIEIEHNDDAEIKLSHNNNISKESATISLFKSNQESNFFYSIIDFYPNFMTYPNVSLSCLIDFEKIKVELTKEEKDYFFKAVIDCVVFKQSDNNFIPKHFFELDSFYHDTEEQKHKDIMKDKILSLAGQKLFRIRAKSNKILEKDDFKKLIDEVIVKSIH